MSVIELNDVSSDFVIDIPDLPLLKLKIMISEFLKSEIFKFFFFFILVCFYLTMISGWSVR